jgi:hypothetical protein
MDTHRNLSDYKKRKRSKDQYLNRWHADFRDSQWREQGVGFCKCCEEPVSTSLIRIGSTYYHTCRMSWKNFMITDESIKGIYVTRESSKSDPNTEPKTTDYRFEKNFTRNELENMKFMDRYRMIVIEGLIDEERDTIRMEEREDWYMKEAKEIIERLKSDKRECMEEIRQCYKKKRKTKRLKRDTNKKKEREEEKERDDKEEKKKMEGEAIDRRKD